MAPRKRPKPSSQADEVSSRLLKRLSERAETFRRELDSSGLESRTKTESTVTGGKQADAHDRAQSATYNRPKPGGPSGARIEDFDKDPHDRDPHDKDPGNFSRDNFSRDNFSRNS